MMNICKGCGILTHIQNKFHVLCGDCVFKKTHGGKSKNEVYKERHDKREKDKQPKPQQRDQVDKKSLVETLKKTFSIKKVSNKKAQRDREMHATYKVIDSTRDPICEGCSRGDFPLSHSHILSQATRPDLAAEEDNIRLHCFGNYHSCHEKWERGVPDEVVHMDDFKENIAYIEMVDKPKFRRIVANFEVAGIKI